MLTLKFARVQGNECQANDSQKSGDAYNRLNKNLSYYPSNHLLTLSKITWRSFHELSFNKQFPTSKSESLKPYGIFQPSCKNFFRSKSTLWKKHNENKSLLYLSCRWHRVNCWSVINWYRRFMLPFKPYKNTYTHSLRRRFKEMIKPGLEV